MVEEDEALVLTLKQDEEQKEAKQKTRNYRRHATAQRSRTKGKPLVAPKLRTSKTRKCLRILVSAAGFEPATHALKGHCSTN
jgi:hypothetical protein